MSDDVTFACGHSFSITVTDAIEEKRGKARLLKEMIDAKQYIGYAEYLKFRKKLKGVLA